MKIILNCLYCNKEYTRKPSHVYKSKCCSRYCHSKCTIAIEKIEKKKCLSCDNIIFDKPSKIDKRKYCSSSCFMKNQNRNPLKIPEKHNVYKNGSGIYRELAINHYGNSCIKCASKDNIEVHHIDENRKNNNMDNLMVLCRSCHHFQHSKHKSNKVCPVCNVTFFKKSRPNAIYCTRACFNNKKSI